MLKRFVLLLQCPDRKGIVALVSQFILRCGGNIITADQYSTDPDGGRFFMRVEFCSSSAARDSLRKDFVKIARRFGAEWRIFDKADTLRMGIMVSRPGHCLAELLYLWKINELRVEIPFILSNFPDHEQMARHYGIPFYFVPATAKDRREKEILGLLKNETDFLVLARYMLVLSKKFLTVYGKDIINIHHGFLPSFKGAHPYRQALEKGVKVIGATAHFANERLDDGPIITQAVQQVSHRDTLETLVSKGRNLEKSALASAVTSYIDYRIIRYGKKTIVF
jgi:formyltetrahydrofolate deformylase